MQYLKMIVVIISIHLIESKYLRKLCPPVSPSGWYYDTSNCLQKNSTNGGE